METLSLERRILIFTKSLNAIDTYFAHWEGIRGITVDRLYKKYINRVVNCKGRYQFYLLMSELLAELKNGHTWYHDNAVYTKWTAFRAFYHDRLKKWVVTRPVGRLARGDVIKSVDGASAEVFFKEKLRYICASSIRSARNKLFAQDCLFPDSFYIKTEDNKKARVKKRTIRSRGSRLDVMCRLIEPGLGYIKIGSFYDWKTRINENAAIKALRKLRNAKALIIDVRGNDGGCTPSKLIKLLMDRSWRHELFEYVVPLDVFQNSPAHATTAKLKYGRRFKKEERLKMHPYKRHYKGRLIMLADHATVSAAEDFLIPFKSTGRAKIVGTTTCGSTGEPYVLDFGDIKVGIGAVRCSMPNGDRFEGVGIKPDVAVYQKLSDMKHGKDSVLYKAIKIAKA